MPPITATFEADFSKFEAAVQSAESELVSLDMGAARVEKTLNRMTDQFSGRKLIQDATLMVEAIDRIGGAAALTEKELAAVSAKAGEAAAKMRAMGMDVPPKMEELARATAKVKTEASAVPVGPVTNLGKAAEGAGGFAGMAGTALRGMAVQAAAAFTVGGVVAFAKATADTADSILKMSAQTGMSVAEVQKLMAVAGDTSVSLGSLVSTSQNLEAALGRRDSGVTGAIADLGLNLKEFMALTPYQRMEQLAGAIGKIEDPTQKATLASAALGKTWKEIGPAMTEEFGRVAAAAPQMSEANAKAIDEFVDDLGRMYSRAKTLLGNTLGEFLNFAAKTKETLANLFPDNVQNMGIASSWAQMMNLINGGTADLAATLNTVAAPAWNTTAVAITGTTLAGNDLKRTIKDLDDQNREAIKENEQRIAAEKKRREEMDEWIALYARASASMRPYQEVMQEVHETVNEWIQSLLESGMSIEEVSKVTSTNTEVVEANARALDANKASWDARDASIRTSMDLQRTLTELQEEHTHSAMERQIADINRWADQYIARLMEQGTMTAETERQIEAIRQQKIANLLIDWNTVDEADRKRLTDQATRARATYEMMAADVARFGQEAVDEQERAAIKAEEAALRFGEAWGSAGEDSARRMVEPHRRAAEEVITTWNAAMEAVRAGQGTMSGTIPQGGPGTMTNYGPWGSPGHVAAIARAYATGRYFGPVLTRGGGPPGSAGAQSYDVDWDALFGDVAQGRASGGPVASRVPYLVGEEGPELFVPAGDGSILANAAIRGTAPPPASGPVVNATFYVNGTGADVARVMVDELTRLMKVGRKWPAV